MKTKHVLIALAVPGAFASCTQENLFNESQQSFNDGRPVVGAMSLNIEEKPASRWGWNGNFTFDEKDFIGAALMDNYNSGETDWDSKYTIVDYINTNYKYGYINNWTNNNAIMSEGNYFFYMPYNEELKSRSGLVFSVPVEQYAYNPEVENPTADALYSWNKNQMFLGYDDILVGDQQAKPQMVEVFAKPRFNVNYTGSNDVKVERIVLTDATGKFNVSSTLKPTSTVTDYNPISGNDDYEGEITSTSTKLNGLFKVYNEAVTEYTLGEGESFVNPLTAGTFFDNVNATKSDFLSLNFVPNKNVTGLMVVPAGSHTADDVTIEVYTTKGLVTISGLSNFGDKEEAAAETGLTYENLDVLETIISGEGSKDEAITINFNDLDIEQPSAVSVATTSQLESIIRWYEDKNVEYGFETLTITLTGDVELTEKVYNVIKGNTELNFKFAGNGKLSIPATVSSDALSLIDPSSTAKVELLGTQNLANSTNTAKTLAAEIVVAEGAELNINGGTVGYTVAKITNNEKCVTDGAVTATDLTNNAELTVNEGSTLTGKIINAVESVVANNYTTYTQNAVITNNGTINLNTGSENQSIIKNNAKIYVVASGTVTNNSVAAVTNSTNGYRGLIENANAVSSYIYSQGTLTNNGDIENAGAIYSQNSGSITNGVTGYIKAFDSATTYITTNDGDIELESRTTETQVNDNDGGSVSYTLKATDLNAKGEFTFNSSSDKFNTLKVGMNVTFSDASKLPANLILNAETNVKVIAATESKFTSIKAEGNVRYTVEGTKIQTEKLVVAEGCVFQIPALSSFGVYDGSQGNTKIDNDGEILVGGNFYSYTTDNIAPDGLFSSAGTGSYIWNDADENFQADDQRAL